MKITKSKLKQIIKEEMAYILENGRGYRSMGTAPPEAPSAPPKIVSGNVGDPETDQVLAGIKQGIHSGRLSKEQLEMLSSILSHNLRTAATNVDLAMQTYQATEDVQFARAAISALQTGAKRFNELVAALGGIGETKLG